MNRLRTKSLLLRIVVPILVVIGWLVLSGIGGPYFGKIDQVSSNDLATFLPKNAEGTKVNDALRKFQDSSTIPAIVVFTNNTPLTTAQKTSLGTLPKALQAGAQVKGTVTAPVFSTDSKAAFIIVPLDSNANFDTAVSSIKQAIDTHQVGVTYKLAGPAMFARDLNNAFAGIDGTLLLVALAVVFVILLVVYRSPFLPILTLMGAMIALASAIFVVWHMANAGILQLNGQVQGILFILVIGATTDYSLLYIARYREELTHHESTWAATKAAWKAAWEPIVAAGGTVSLGLLCLLASDLGSNKALGPVGSIGVVFAVLVALTFLPAALLLFGRVAFWPRRPKHVPGKGHLDYHSSHPVWAKVGAFVGRYPRRVWIVLVVLLGVAACFVPQLKADGVAQSDLVLGKSEARDGQALLDAHFPAGSGSPAYVLVPQSEQSAVVSELEADKGVDTVSVITTDPTKSPAPVGKLEDQIKQKLFTQLTAQRETQLAALKQQLAAQMVGESQAVIDQAYVVAASHVPSVQSLMDKVYPFSGTVPRVVNGEVMLAATLKDPANSLAARDTIQRLRSTIESKQRTVEIGGTSALQLDTNNAAQRDLTVIIPLILAAITIVLMLLLRAVVAPLVLLFTTVLSFGATLGIAALLFNHVWQYPGADPSVVIFGFVFLVALGIDYNIFLMTRVREETAKVGVRNGTLKALVVTGGVITSAGIVLASTFAALYVIPILFLAQIAFIVAFGVLLDTFIVRSLIVPGLTLTIGRIMWWPSRLARRGGNRAHKR